jgi:cytochrome c oxidase cbb3-type subunit I/II
MLDKDLDTSSTAPKIRTMQKLGVPYPAGYDRQANAELMAQANTIRESLSKDGIKTPANKEIIALIAYMQRLGTDITRSQTAQIK